MIVGFHNLQPGFAEDLFKLVFRPHPSRGHNPYLHIYRCLDPGRARARHQHIVDEELAVAWCHRILDVAEDHKCVLVVPVEQDIVHIVSTSAPDRLRFEKVVSHSSDLCIAGRLPKNRRHILKEQLVLMPRVCHAEALDVFALATANIDQQRASSVVRHYCFGVIKRRPWDIVAAVACHKIVEDSCFCVVLDLFVIFEDGVPAALVLLE